MAYDRLKARGIPEKSTFEKILSGLSKPGALVRNAIADNTGIKNDVQTSEILKGEKTFTPRDLLEGFGKKYNIDLQFGTEGEMKSGESVANFITEFAVDTITDPLSLLAFGSGAATEALMKNANLSAKAAKIAARAITGGVFGAATGDTGTDAAKNALIGAATLGFGPAAIRKAGSGFLRKYGDDIADMMVESANPEVFKNAKLGFSKAYKIVNRTSREHADIARQVREIDNTLGFSNLGPLDSRKLANFIDGKNSATHTFRNKIESEFLRNKLKVPKVNVPKKFDDVATYITNRAGDAKFGDRFIVVKNGNKWDRYVSEAGSPKFAMDRSSAKFSALKPHNSKKIPLSDINSTDAFDYGMRNGSGKVSAEVSRQELNALTKRSNTYIGKLANEEISKSGDNVLMDAKNRWVERNRKVMDIHNKAQRARYGDSAAYVEPIDFHTMEIKARENFTDAIDFDNVKGGIVRRKSDAPIESAGLTFQERAQIEAERFHKGLLSKTEKEAQRIVDGVRHYKNPEKGFTAVRNGMEKYDKFTRFLKQQHLTFSHSWIVNNYTDNVLKSYMVGGTSQAWKTMLAQSSAAFRNKSDDLVKDLLRITDPNGAGKLGVKMNSDIVDTALQHGAIQEGLFKEAFEDGTMSSAKLIATVGKEEADKVMLEASKGVPDVKKLYGKYKDFLKNTVGRTGTLMENATRVTSFKHHVDMITSSDDMLKNLGIKMSSNDVKSIIKKNGLAGSKEVLPSIGKVYSEAARITNETFFDYSNISAFEDVVMKRIFPYWTYFSKNLPQWGELVAKNPDKFAAYTRAHRSLGREPTARERAGLPDYLLGKGARIGSNGQAITAPNVSFFDSMALATGEESGMQKFHPLLKLAKQLVTSEDDFGGELLPSNTRSGQKRVFGAAEKFAPLTNSVYRGRDGKLYTDSDMFQRLQTIQKNALPVPLIDTIAKALEKREQGVSLLDSLMNLGPVKQTALDRRSTAKTRRFRRKQSLFDRKNEARIRRAKR